MKSEELAKYYDPNYFYEYGANPAFKNLVKLTKANYHNGKSHIDFRTVTSNKPGKIFFARDLNDVFERELKLYTTPRAFANMISCYGLLAMSVYYCTSYLPVGSYGITKVSQTQFYKVYGKLGAGFAISLPIVAGYIFAKSIIYFCNMFYKRVILQERNWLFEMQKYDNIHASYMFLDTPLASEDSLNLDQREALGGGIIPDPLWKDDI